MTKKIKAAVSATVLMFGFSNANAQTQSLTVNDSNQITIKLPQQSTPRCNIQIVIPGVYENDDVEVSAPSYEAKVTLPAANYKNTELRWEGKTKFKGLGTNFGCNGSGSVSVNSRGVAVAAVTPAPAPAPATATATAPAPALVSTSAQETRAGKTSSENQVGYVSIETLNDKNYTPIVARSSRKIDLFSCTLAAESKDEDAQIAFIAKIYQAELTKQINENKALSTNFSSANSNIERFSDLGKLFEWVQRGDCATTFAQASKASTIISGVDRIKFEYKLQSITPSEVLALQAKAEGYNNVTQYEFARSIKSNPQEIEKFSTFGIVDKDGYVAAWSKMISSNYKTGKGEVKDLISFLEDEKEGKISKRSAVQVQDARNKELARQSALEAAQRQKAIEERARNFPFEATISCGMPPHRPHLNLLSCFFSDGLRTELTINKNNISNMYTVNNIQTAGTSTSNGLVIELPRKFAITAQNSQRNLTLTLEIKDVRTDKVIFRQQAAQYGVVSARN